MYHRLWVILLGLYCLGANCFILSFLPLVLLADMLLVSVKFLHGVKFCHFLASLSLRLWLVQTPLMSITNTTQHYLSLATLTLTIFTVTYSKLRTPTNNITTCFFSSNINTNCSFNIQSLLIQVLETFFILSSLTLWDMTKGISTRWHQRARQRDLGRCQNGLPVAGPGKTPTHCA